MLPKDAVIKELHKEEFVKKISCEEDSKQARGCFLGYKHVCRQKGLIEISSNLEELNFDVFLKRFASFATRVCCTGNEQLKIISTSENISIPIR